MQVLIMNATRPVPAVPSFVVIAVRARIVGRSIRWVGRRTPQGHDCMDITGILAGGVRQDDNSSSVCLSV